MGLNVSLTAFELEMAALIGCRRMIEDVFNGLKDSYGAKREDGWRLHIEGAAAEMAFAKWSNKYYSGHLGNLAADDVDVAQVRSTPYSDGHLLLHPPPKDKPNKPYVLLTGLAPNFTVRGWIRGRDGMKDQYWKDPQGGRPAWFVPQSALRLFPDKDQQRLAL